jgi:predicted negative regulator of RcsB-dependent stress response
MESENKQSGDLYTLLGWLEKNRNQVITGVVVVILAGIIYFYFDYRKSERAVEAGQQLSAALLTGTTGGPSADALLKVANDNAGTDAGARALLTAAGKQFVDGKIDDAKASFQRFVSEYPESPLMNQAKYGIAVCLDTQGKGSEAATAFKEVMDRYAGENTTAPSKFALARIYEADGKLEQARDYYMDLARDGRNTFGMEAGSRVMALFQKHPNLRPTSTSAMNKTAVAPTP